MKTSDKVLISFLLMGLLTLFGSAVALKTEHDKIDFTDPFYSFSSVPVKAFRVLKVEGSKGGKLVRGESTGGPDNRSDSYTTVGIQVGKLFEIRVQKDSKIPLTYRSVGDTLIVRYEPEFYYKRINADDVFTGVPFVYVIAPSVQTLVATNTICQLSGLHTEALAITTKNARVLISNSSIGNLTAAGHQGSLLQTVATDRIQTATITSRDSTEFIAKRDVFGSLKLQNDSTAVVKVPASLLKKIL